MAGSSGESKTLPPTRRHLRQLRRRGQVPRSRELIPSAALIAVTLYVILGAHHLFTALTSGLQHDIVTGRVAFAERLAVVLPDSFLAAATALVPLVVLLGIAVLGASIMDAKGIAISPEALTFNVLRLKQGLQSVFSLQGLLDSIRVLLKALILTAAFAVLARYRLNDLMWAPTCGAACAGAVALNVLAWVVGIGIAATLLSAAIDLPLSRALFRRDHRMSKSEQKREERDDTGSPEIRKRRKELREAASQKGAPGRARAAGMQPNLVIAGDHAAVALYWRAGETQAPVILAQPRDAEAADLVAEARAASIVVARNERLTRLLIRSGRVGGHIPQQAFRGVAEILHANGLV